MNNTLGGVKTPWHLWVVGILTLLWNAVGGWSYTATQTGNLEGIGMSDEAIAYVSNFPAWADTLWALGVWGAIIGSILILLRSRHAVTAIGVAIVGLIGTTIYQRVLTELPADMQGIGLPIAIWATTLFMLYYAVRMRNDGVLK